MSKHRITIALYIDSVEGLDRALESISGQPLFSQKQATEVLLLDAACTDETRSACKAFAALHKNGVTYVSCEELTAAESYNRAIPMAQGEYLWFLQSYAWLSSGTLDAVAQLLSQKHALLCVRPMFRLPAGGWARYAMSPATGGKVDLNETPGNCPTLLMSCLIRRDCIGDLRFDPARHDEALPQFLLHILLKNRKFYYLENVTLSYDRAQEDQHGTYLCQHHLWWYTPSMEGFLDPLLTQSAETYGEIPLFLQNAVLYFIYTKFNCNYNDREKGVLDKAGYEAFYAACGKTLGAVDAAVILQNRSVIKPLFSIPRPLRVHLLRAKVKAAGQSMELILDESACYAQLSGPTREGAAYDAAGGEETGEFQKIHRIAGFAGEHILVDIMDFQKGSIEIDAHFSGADFLEPGSYRLFALIDGKDVPVTPTEVYPLIKCFGHTFAHRYPFHLSVTPTRKDLQRIQFFLEIGGWRYPLRIRFPSAYSKLTTGSTRAYWCFSDRTMRCVKNCLIIEKNTAGRHFKRELAFWAAKLRYAPCKRKAVLYLGLRMLYWLLRPFYRGKHIWVTFDKLYKAGDNGEYLYHYVHDHTRDGVKIYYIVNPNSPDYARLKSQKKARILKHGSPRCRLISLYAEAILATHATVSSYCGFYPTTLPYFKDLFRGDVVCIQHGLTIQQIAQYQNRVFDNTRLYGCASKYEIENLKRPIYDFDDDALKLPGLARYDGLKNNDQKQILITPTWRRNIVNSGIAFVKKSHNDFFKQSEYYEIYNGLINDERLIACAKEHGYDIIYLLHPAMSAQIDDYERNDYVKLIPAAGDMSYEKILTESSLMVTDYSGVQFDFAYMRKPIVYYHPETLPPHYEEGGLIYETMGFGPICVNHQQIVDTLCAYMERGCETEPLYIDRANDFFAHDDFENCRRIYEMTQAYLKEKRQYE